MKPYTVIFYIDTERAVEYFVERVIASTLQNAFDVAVQQAKYSGCSSSGHSIAEYEWESATEIAIFVGHAANA